MHEEEKPASSPSTPEPSSPTSESHDVPDWLKDTHETSVSTSTPSWLTEETPEIPVETPTPEVPPQSVAKIEDESHADIPDWLKSTETAVTPEATNASSEPSFHSETPETIEEKEETGISAPVVEEKNETPIAHEELPDWLKGAETASEISETKTPEVNV